MRLRTIAMSTFGAVTLACGVTSVMSVWLHDVRVSTQSARVLERCSQLTGERDELKLALGTLQAGRDRMLQAAHAQDQELEQLRTAARQRRDTLQALRVAKEALDRAYSAVDVTIATADNQGGFAAAAASDRPRP